jgi:hypothetical protein
VLFMGVSLEGMDACGEGPNSSGPPR